MRQTKDGVRTSASGSCKVVLVCCVCFLDVLGMDKNIVCVCVCVFLTSVWFARGMWCVSFLCP